MSTSFITAGAWNEITAAIQKCRARSYVAVAYLGSGARPLLPLKAGSVLIVDASERTVAAGQTCPKELLAMVRGGVRVFSAPNLHAKVFVAGETAFVGSTNVSNHSASQLMEAVVRTSHKRTVAAAKAFVRANCLHELTPRSLDQLQKKYRPPRFPFGPKSGRSSRSKSLTFPPLKLAQLQRCKFSERDDREDEKARAVARKHMEHPRSFELESFRYEGRRLFKPKDMVIEVVKQEDARRMVAPAGTVLHVRTIRYPRSLVSFICHERPAGRYKDLKSLAKKLGPGAQKLLLRNGKVGSTEFTRRLLTALKPKL